MIATFIGHRKIQNSELLTEQIKRTILNLIDEKQVDTFLFGSRSAFDDLCLEFAVDRLGIALYLKFKVREKGGNSPSAKAPAGVGRGLAVIVRRMVSRRRGEGTRARRPPPFC